MLQFETQRKTKDLRNKPVIIKTRSIERKIKLK